MKPIVFHPDVAQEAEDAVDYYDALWFGLGDDFRTDLDAALARIQQNPKLYALPSRDSSGFAFSIDSPTRFTSEEFPDRIWIAAVGHHSRRPGYWARRRPN